MFGFFGLPVEKHPHYYAPGEYEEEVPAKVYQVHVPRAKLKFGQSSRRRTPNNFTRFNIRLMQGNNNKEMHRCLTELPILLITKSGHQSYIAATKVDFANIRSDPYIRVAEVKVTRSQTLEDFLLDVTRTSRIAPKNIPIRVVGRIVQG